MTQKKQYEGAKAALTAFMSAWKDKKWAAMEKACQLTWRQDGHPGRNGNEWLREQFGKAKVAGWTIESSQVAGKASYDVALTIRFGVFNVETRMARVICERGAHKPNPDGVWGVNPVSIQRKAL